MGIDAAPPAEVRWVDGQHLTGEWGGARPALEDRGVELDGVYALDLFTVRGHGSVLDHFDLALTLDTDKLGLWPGGTIYALGQINAGDQVNDLVGSGSQVTNLEAPDYQQLSELFLEQTLADGKLKFRIGKQDANRDFGTPRFSGNFINNSFGMLPNSPLPSYPTTGMGAIVIGQPIDWLAGKLALYEGTPESGGFGLTSAFHSGAGYMVAGSVEAKHFYGPDHRDGGTTSVGGWSLNDADAAMGVYDPTRFHSDAGVFVQNDERIFLHPEDPKDPRGLNVIVRYSLARGDRSMLPRYVGGSAAWHGLGARDNDTIGVGFNTFTVQNLFEVPIEGQPVGQVIPGREWAFEAFYKARLTEFFSLQPDLQAFLHPSGVNRNAFVVGLRIKAKL
jgi:porin